jgi:hypothetical protein
MSINKPHQIHHALGSIFVVIITSVILIGGSLSIYYFTGLLFSLITCSIAYFLVLGVVFDLEFIRRPISIQITRDEIILKFRLKETLVLKLEDIEWAVLDPGDATFVGKLNRRGNIKFKNFRSMTPLAYEPVCELVERYHDKFGKTPMVPRFDE